MNGGNVTVVSGGKNVSFQLFRFEVIGELSLCMCHQFFIDAGFQLFRFEVIGEPSPPSTLTPLVTPSFQLFRFEVIGELTVRWKRGCLNGINSTLSFQLFRFEVIGEQSP